MFDKKIEPVAQKYIRAQLMLKEAEELAELAKTDLQRVLPEGTNYVTKDGDTVTHVKSSVRKSWIVEMCKQRFPLRIWKACRIDALDTKKLNGFIEAGELDVSTFTDCFEQVPVRSSVRITWAPSVPTTKRKAA